MEEEFRAHINRRADDLERAALHAQRPNGKRGSSLAAINATGRSHEAMGGAIVELSCKMCGCIPSVTQVSRLCHCRISALALVSEPTPPFSAW